MNISIIIPMEDNRVELFNNSLIQYQECDLSNVEFIFVSRNIPVLKFSDVNSKLINYTLEGDGFSQAKALNLGIKATSYDNIIVTSPEVMPKTKVIEQLMSLPRGNYICQVFAQNEKGEEYMSLVNSKFRSNTPAMHFLALFKKEDLELINGWSLDYQNGSGAYDDDDFGDRFVKAGLKFEVRDEIQAVHQYHPPNKVDKAWIKNQELFEKQRASKNYYAKRGLRES